MFTPRIIRELKTAVFNEALVKKSFDSLFVDKNGLYLFGPSGEGKTLYACKVLDYISKQFEGTGSYGFISVPQLLEDIRKLINSSFDGKSDLIKEVQDYDYLILDDIGVEKVSEWVLQTFYLIINHRYEYCKPTIFTSNYSLKELSAKFGEQRIVFRIQQMTVPVAFKRKK